MARGIFVFVLQLVVSVGITSIGIWAVLRPKHLQAFINENFALLPTVRPKSFIAPTLIRTAGLGVILYGYMLALNYKDEIVWLGKVFRVTN
jgi:hypothetical protein